MATIGFFFVAATCQAGTVTAHLDSFSSDDTISINDGHGGNAFTEYGGGLFNWSNGSNAGLGSNFVTYCIQLGSTQNDIYAGTTYTYTIKPITSGTNNGINPSNYKAIELLWGGFYNQTLGSTPTAVQNAEAFQLALWRLEYDYAGAATSTDFTTGQFRATGPDAVITLAQQLVQNATDGTYTTPTTNLVTLTDGTYSYDGTTYSDPEQDQLAVATPEPSSICLSAIGVATLLAARYRRRLKVTM